MQVCDVIRLLKQQGPWVDWQGKTRDRLLVGDRKQAVKRIGVCWVATRQAIAAAIEQEIDFIITHENPFYQCSTQMNSAAYEAAQVKRQLLQEHGISVYRCHDVWDRIGEYGVVDQWAKRLGYPLDDYDPLSYYRIMHCKPQSLSHLAQHVSNVLEEDGAGGVYLFGNSHRTVQRIVSGTGAITDLYEMLKYEPDAVIVSDDGVRSFDAAQYVLDHDLGMVVVNHAACERAGLKAMVPWLNKRIHDAAALYVDDGFLIRYYTNHQAWDKE